MVFQDVPYSVNLIFHILISCTMNFDTCLLHRCVASMSVVLSLKEASVCIKPQSYEK